MNNKIYSDARGTYFKTNKVHYSNALITNKLVSSIKSIIATWINPALGSHEGSCTLTGIEYNSSNEITIHISYEGKCSKCQSSANETLMMIRETIVEELSEQGLFRGRVNIKNTGMNIYNENELLPYDLLD